MHVFRYTEPAAFAGCQGRITGLGFMHPEQGACWCGNALVS